MRVAYFGGDHTHPSHQALVTKSVEKAADVLVMERSHRQNGY
ncbi:MAG: hypothetical protein AAF716_08600 [Cyanobacteria bacterium P01_D01_bin.1]